MVDKKIIVYSCVTGNYEKPVAHKEISDDIKYIFFTELFSILMYLVGEFFDNFFCLFFQSKKG